MAEIENIVREIIEDILPLNKNIEEISLEEDLQNCGMDSLICIQIIIEIEDRLNIEIPEEKLGLSFVSNIEEICKLIVDESP
jgi:acyl carrier protein